MAASTDFTGKFSVAEDSAFDPKKLAGRSAVVTGGASGIGEAVVRDLVKHGVYVTFSDLTGERGQQLVSELGADKVTFVQGNVTDWNDQVRLFKTAAEKSPTKGVDVVVANAGTGGSGHESIVHAHTDVNGEPQEPNLTVFDTNLRGQQYTTSLALHSFAKLPASEAKDGCLVMVASTAGYLDMPGGVQYQVSKFGMRGVMRSLRPVLPQFGARVNAIAPWWVKTRIINTEQTKRIDDSGLQWCEVEDVSAAILHIISDRQINGRTLGIVPRSVHKRGYTDLREDDHFTGTRGTNWEKMIGSLMAGAKVNRGILVQEST